MNVIEENIAWRTGQLIPIKPENIGSVVVSMCDPRDSIPIEGHHVAGHQRIRQTAFALLDNGLRLLALGEIDLHVHDADNPALLVEQRRGTGHDRNERAGWPFN